MKLRFRTELSYGIGGVADNALYTLKATYHLFFLTTVAGLKPAIAGTIVAVGSIWDAIASFHIGYVSDNINTRYGRSKPFILLAAIPAAIFTSLCFLSLNAGYTAKVIYYFAMTVLFWQSFAAFYIPYISWGSALTDDYDERTKLRSFAYVGNQVGMALGMVLPSVLEPAMISKGYSERQAWFVIGAIVGAIAAASLLVCAFSIKETDDPGYKREKGKKSVLFSASQFKRMFTEFFCVVRLKPAVYLLISCILALAANTFFNSAIIYNFKYRFGITGPVMTASLATIMATGIIYAPLINKISASRDKTSVYRTCMFSSGLALIFLRFAGASSVPMMFVTCAVFSVGNTAYWQLMPSMIYDVCEADELATGVRHAGTVVSIQALSESFACAAGAQALGAVLQVQGFDETLEVQTASALTAIENCSVLIPGIIFLCAGLIFRMHPLNKKTYARIVEALNDRKEGRPVDMYSMRDIFGNSLRGVNPKFLGGVKNSGNDMRGDAESANI